MKKLFLLLISLFISGCIKPYKAKVLVSSNDYYQIVTKKKNSKPTLGIALSGGGSKASPFAMGVLKKFVDEGWIDNVDIISSVSGGGYSAYYLYSKAIYMDKHKDENLTLRTFFKNCELDKLSNVTNYNDYIITYNKECKDNNYSKYQNHVKKYQDLLSFVQSETARGASYIDNIKATGTVIGGISASIASAPIHHISNSLFDWKVELSPTQYLYKKGIVRAFGKMPDINLSNHKNETFEDLNRALDNNKNLPLWIINTANFKETWWKDAFKSNQPNLDYTIFEITPYGFGSMEHNYSLDSPTKLGLDLPRATLASAAFFDALGDRGYQGIAFGALHLVNMRWGVKIPNYVVSAEHQKWHNVLPLPFYYLDLNASKITLADGGQSGDNLGIYSLIKRGVKNIVIVSGSHDAKKEKLKLEDMCSVSKFLRKKNMTVWFKGIPTDKNNKKPLNFYNEFCKKDGNFYHQISYYNWQKPIWKGYIKNNDKNISILYYIKAAIDKEDLNISANKIANDFYSKKDKNNKKHKDYIQGDRYKEKQRYNYHYPYSLAFFWQENSYGKSTSNFPQTSTVTNTLNSSQNLYQAYMDLGFYLSGYLKNDDDLKKILENKK